MPYAKASVFDEVASVALADACIGLERYDEVVQLLEEFIVKFPSESDLYWSMILACIYSGRFADADEWMLRVEEMVQKVKSDKYGDKELCEKWEK